jgi:flagellar assembly protein FliH
MALIRHAEFVNAGREAVVLDLGDLMRQGERIKAAARAEADRIAAAAREERERLLAGAADEGRKAGFEQGLAQGLTEGERKGREEALADAKPRLEALVTRWSEALAAFEAAREDMLRDARRDVVRLAALAAEKLARRAVRLNESSAADQLAAVLGLIVRPTRLVVAVHPGDEAIVREAAPALVEKLSAGSHVEFVTDPGLTPGSCVARTPGGGEIDASIQTQVDRMLEALLPGEPRTQSAGHSETPRPVAPAPGARSSGAPRARKGKKR